MKKIIFLFLFLFLFISCYCQEVKKISLTINSSVEYNNDSKNEYKKIINLLREFINSKNSTFKDNPSWIKNDNVFFLYPFLDLINIEYIQGNYRYNPTLLSISQTQNKNQFIAKIGWFKSDENKEISLRMIYNILVIKNDSDYLLKNILTHNISNWKEFKFENIRYLINPSHQFEEIKAKEFSKINDDLAVYFECDKISFTYFLCNSNKELMQTLGYDFEETMYFSNQNGAITYPNDNLIFSGNNSEINKHEAVHLYTFQKFKNKNNIIDEGIATFLGGSKALNYAAHLEKLKNHLKNNPINLHDELFNNNYVLDESTSLRYTLGAFLCDLSLKKGGKNLLFQLLNSGSTNEELIIFLKSTFDIKDNSLHDFFLIELNK